MDTEIIKLPYSGVEAELRTRITRKDQKKLQRLIMSASPTVKVNELENLDVDTESIIELQDKKILMILERIGDNTDNLDVAALEELDADDYDVLSEKTSEIFRDKEDAAVRRKKSQNGAKTTSEQ